MAKLIHLIAAARPNFMKIAPLYHELIQENWATTQIIHTGQHYDPNMSDSFFSDLQLPAPHIHLGIGGGSHAQQTAKVMMAYETVLLEKKPDMVVVVGDVNSTMACTLAAVKINYDSGRHIQRPVVAHLEAGLRSFDRTMPEEINRIVTDSLADLLWTPSPDGDENLLREGVAPEKIARVGNIMIDSLERMRAKIEEQDTCSELGFPKGGFAVVTFHRPGNVDDPEKLKTLCGKLKNIAHRIPLVFPVHPRTRKNLSTYGLYDELKRTQNIVLSEPLSYVSFMSLVFNCGLAITDSGGIQEETTYLGIPCLTMRPNTERPVTITEGTNRLCSIDDLEDKAEEMLGMEVGRHVAPALWDGHTAGRVVQSIKTNLGPN